MPQATRPTQLSPSRAADFKQCPLLYRFRAVDRLPEPPTKAQVQGTLVHAVLERLYEVEAGKRTPAEALALIEPEWAKLQTSGDYAELFDGLSDESDWLRNVRGLVETYFNMEDPTRLQPHRTECLVTTTLDDGTQLKGFIDRADVNVDGLVRLVDYKTGKRPPDRFADKALFQMKFYALVWWRTRGTVPTLLRLMYLGNAQVLDYSPNAVELESFEKTLRTLWATMREAIATGEFRPQKSKLCGWCAHQKLCPEFGGEPPSYPLPTVLPGLEMPPTD
ncbi:RecB family exonuclease [Glycomyces buryatensis]|uniref:RecB family exonuclease n=1 Tax=Glycomyces buryatensis TaxID=2570927 RepID=A0A4S8PQL1_9ACTN|nr:RecB family exonuclease [Glycomyces buryatensis]THV33377.1 RecB family exonuclease [Glycomyces buryatensis]